MSQPSPSKLLSRWGKIKNPFWPERLPFLSWNLGLQDIVTIGGFVQIFKSNKL
jgi:hypothetical protein